MIEAHPWDPKLDLANEGMDHDHHLQIALIAAFADAVQQHRPWLARRLAEQLLRYTAAHFDAEELLMEASRYPERAVHTGEHRDLLEDVRGLAATRSGAEGIALDAAIDLQAALERHIAAADRRLAAHAAPHVR